jgi:hypothetical protein
MSDDLKIIDAPFSDGPDYLHAITRLTLLFDVAQSFSSTIQVRELATTICNRTANVMDADSCALWFVEKPTGLSRDLWPLST